VKETPVSAVPFDIFQLFKSGFLLLTIGQSFLQPYWSWKHLSSIDAIIVKKSKALLHFKALYEGTVSLFKEHGYTLSPIPFAPDITDPRQLVAHAHLHTVYLKTARKRLGALEALVCLAKQENMVPVYWSDRPCLELTDAYDYNVPSSIRKTFDISMDQQTGHALLTGPNRGGKSTTLRSVLTSCLLAHTYGCAPASKAIMSPLNTLFVCLTPEDLPGQKSRFEREIEFTAQTLKANSDQRHLVLLDELYHSTNPPDAEKACRIYTERLWQQQNTMSIVSTHLFDFVEQAPPTIQRLCCPATMNGDVINYSYRLTEGVCKVSSVQELLVENGLITSV
jgi:DNA mismatch repair ATPase MutS